MSFLVYKYFFEKICFINKMILKMRSTIFKLECMFLKRHHNERKRKVRNWEKVFATQIINFQNM